MDTVNEMILSVCVLSIITGIINAVVPHGKYTSQIRLLTACLLLVGMFSPIAGTVSEISDADFEIQAPAAEYAEDIYEAADEQTIVLAEEELADALRQELAAQAIPCSRITAEMNTLDDMSINISSVTIVSTKPNEAEAAVRELLGEEVDIYAGSIN